MFVCGPTVYDYVHIGNARTFVFFDFVVKYLRFKGFDVDYVQNITDIDDKIISKAIKAGKEPAEIAKTYEMAFHENMKALGVTSVSKYARATDFMPEIISQVKRLIENGNAYKIDGDGWYFDLKTFPEYGKLSGRTMEMADDAVSRIDENENKHNRGDFCLWKLSKDGEPTWDGGRFGAGRPGWHIEDTAITEKFFGPQYDIHGGGQDLMFPHHEAEIAQQCSASGIEAKDFVKFWMHTGMLVNKEQKMSKSTGNFMTLNDALKKYSPEVLRFYFFSSHYRSQLDYSIDNLKSAEAAIQGLYEIDWRLQHLDLPKRVESSEAVESVRTFEHDFVESVDDDFNIPRAVAAIFELVKKINKCMDLAGVSKEQALQVKQSLFRTAGNLLGIVPNVGFLLPGTTQTLIDIRQKARENKDFATADKLRKEISSLGYQIDDTPYGPLIKKK